MAVIEVEELLDESPELPEALRLLGTVLLEIGDAEGATLTLEHFMSLCPEVDADTRADLSMARLESCDIDGAIREAREALRLAPDFADAHFILGLALEHKPGQKTAAAAATYTAWKLDPEACPLPLDIQPREWDELVHAAVSVLDAPYQTFWHGVPLTIFDLPDLRDLQASEPPTSPTIGGLFVGIPPEPPCPDARPSELRLYARNLCRVRDRVELVERLAELLHQEALNWWGIEHEDLVAAAEA